MLFLSVSAASRVNKSQPIGNVVFVKSPFFNCPLNVCSNRKSFFNKKSLKKVLLTF